jgi:hypothetical protein
MTTENQFSPSRRATRSRASLPLPPQFPEKPSTRQAPFAFDGSRRAPLNKPIDFPTFSLLHAKVARNRDMLYLQASLEPRRSP